MKEDLNGTFRKFFLSSLSHCVLGELGSYCEGSGGLPNLGVIGVFPFCHPSDPVPSTRKFGSSLFKLHLDSDHCSPLWSNLPSVTWALVSAAASPFTPAYPSPPSSLTCSQVSWRKRQGPHHLQGPSQVECPPLLPHHLPAPALVLSRLPHHTDTVSWTLQAGSHLRAFACAVPSA